MKTDERLAALEQRVRQQDAVILGLKKELGVLRNRLAPAATVPKGECRLGLGDECTRANTYQYQKGCRGDACMEARAKYYNKHDEQPVEVRRKVMKRGGQ